MNTARHEDGLQDTGRKIYGLIQRLFPICRSITGDGVRESLRIIGEYIPLEIREVPSGTRVFDWKVPREWNIRDAFIADGNGNKIVDFKKNNLHIVGYSIPVDRYVSLAELQPHLHSLEDQPDAVPYVTSYYEERWGFCISHRERERLKEGDYYVYIDSELKDGHLTYGECILSGEREEEIFISTYICHPSMTNDNLSGPAVTAFLGSWIAGLRRKYTYRIIFIPETIGSITYLSRNLDMMKRNVVAGFNVTCVGDGRVYSFLPSRQGNTLADRIALNVLGHRHPDFITYRYLDRGSDERQYCSPGVDLPVVSLMRSKYGTYPEYHTSLDNLDIISSHSLEESYSLLRDCLLLAESNTVYRATCLGEPQLARRNLYPTLSVKGSSSPVKLMRNMLAYADGVNDLIDCSNIIGVPVEELYPIIDILVKEGLLDEEVL